MYIFTAAWQAIKDEFPTVEIRGCVFHLTQAIWRKVQNCGLVATYNTKGKVITYSLLLIYTNENYQNSLMLPYYMYYIL